MIKKTSHHLNRRDFAKAAGLGTAGLLLGNGLPSLTRASERPNVLLVIADQWRLPRWFPERAELPGFDRLRREGLGFTNSFVSAVPCSPSRACLFTGMHLTQHGVQNNVNLNMNPSLDPRIPTLGHRFQEAGFRTPYFGKWHLIQPDEYRRVGLSAYGFEAWHGPDHDGTPLDGTRHDPRFASQAIHWLLRHGREKPWFLTCSLINPHDICYYHRLDVPSPLVAHRADRLPDNFEDDLSTKPRIQAIYQKGYGRLMRSTPDQPKKFWLRYLDYYYYFQRLADAELHRLLAALDHLKLADNTLVVFTSDHGEMAGSHRLQAKGPFVYQENNNVPLVFRWPGKIQPGTCDALAHNPDLHPTLLALAGIAAPVDHLPGKSLAPAIAQPGETKIHDQVLMGFGMRGGGRFGRIAARLGLSTEGVPMQIRAIYDGRYKYARYFDPGVEEEYEFYDLLNDPLELHNLAADPGSQALRREMADRLAEAEAKEMAPLSREFLRKG